jgi:hypothetical protein
MVVLCIIFLVLLAFTAREYHYNSNKYLLKPIAVLANKDMGLELVEPQPEETNIKGAEKTSLTPEPTPVKTESPVKVQPEPVKDTSTKHIDTKNSIKSDEKDTKPVKSHSDSEHMVSKKAAIEKLAESIAAVVPPDQTDSFTKPVVSDDLKLNKSRSSIDRKKGNEPPTPTASIVKKTTLSNSANSAQKPDDRKKKKDTSPKLSDKPLSLSDNVTPTIKPRSNSAGSGVMPSFIVDEEIQSFKKRSVDNLANPTYKAKPVTSTTASQAKPPTFVPAHKVKIDKPLEARKPRKEEEKFVVKQQVDKSHSPPVAASSSVQTKLVPAPKEMPPSSLSIFSSPTPHTNTHFTPLQPARSEFVTIPVVNPDTSNQESLFPAVQDTWGLNPLSVSPPQFAREGISSLNSSNDTRWSSRKPSNPVGVIGSGKSIKKPSTTTWDPLLDPNSLLNNTQPAPNYGFSNQAFAGPSLFSNPFVTPQPATTNSSFFSGTATTPPQTHPAPSQSGLASFFSDTFQPVSNPPSRSTGYPSSYQLFESPIPPISSLKDLQDKE